VRQTHRLSPRRKAVPLPLEKWRRETTNAIAGLHARGLAKLRGLLADLE
jgi:hypothetical protein